MQFNNLKKCLRDFIAKICTFLPTLFWILLIFGFDTVSIGVLTIITALIHEGGHIFMAFYLTGGAKVNGDFNGLRLFSQRFLSYKETILIALGGPGINILLFFMLLPFFGLGRGYIALFGILNLFTALSNLMPIDGYDGYKILSSLLGLHTNSAFIHITMYSISFFCSALLCFLSLYLMAKLNTGYFVYFIFLAVLIKSVRKSKRVILREKKRKQEFLRENKSFFKD